jgi:hypothetical protein
MKNTSHTSSQQDSVQQVAAELAGLFERQVELTKREALVGLTPAECEEYDQIVQGIRESYIELAKLRSAP